MSSWLSAASSQLAELWLTHQLAQELVDCVPVPICVVRTPELTIALANRKMRELLDRTQPVGHSLRELAYPCLDSLCRALDAAANVLEPQSLSCDEVEGGQYSRELDKHYDWTLCPLRTSGFTAALGHEVTGHVRVRRALERAHLRSEEASRKKGELIAQVAHELRNPLASISAAVEVVRQRGDRDPHRAHAVLERQTRHLSRLVDDLVDGARSERRTLSLSRKRVGLSEIIEQAVDVATPLLNAHKHGLDIDLGDDLHVDGDPVRLTQVVCNLVTNAAKYTADGGSIRITGRKLQGEVVVSITDTGMGIEREMLPRVFDQFVQLPGSEERSDGGLGLGLHIVQMLVREHGGRVEAQSDGLGRGSKFTVHLPALPVTPSKE